MNNKFKLFIPLAKINKEKKIVEGYASTEAMDSQGEIIKLSAIKKALPDYMKWKNIREMHQLSAVGKTLSAKVDDKGLYIKTKIVDKNAWEKVKEGIYNGFSIGGQKLLQKGKEVLEIIMNEISIVDRPANPEAVFTLFKADTSFEKIIELLYRTINPKNEVSKYSITEVFKNYFIVFSYDEEKYYKIKYSINDNKIKLGKNWVEVQRDWTAKLDKLNNIEKALGYTPWWIKNNNLQKAVWTTVYINNLPDAAFAYIEPGGKKDNKGKTIPRSKRHFPHHNTSVKSGTENSSVDKPHLRNALARLSQSNLSATIKNKILAHLKAHAKALGIGIAVKSDNLFKSENMTLKDIISKKPEELSDEEKTFLEANQDQLSDEDKKKFGFEAKEEKTEIKETEVEEKKEEGNEEKNEEKMEENKEEIKEATVKLPTNAKELLIKQRAEIDKLLKTEEEKEKLSKTNLSLGDLKKVVGKAISDQLSKIEGLTKEVNSLKEKFEKIDDEPDKTKAPIASYIIKKGEEETDDTEKKITKLRKRIEELYELKQTLTGNEYAEKYGQEAERLATELRLAKLNL